MAAKPSLRTRIPRVFNGLIWITFCGLAGTGLILAWRLPPGSRGGHGLSVLGWGRHDWGDLHTWLAYAFLLMVLVHIGLHWRWFWQIAARKRRWPLLLGLGGGIAAMAILAALPVEKDDSATERHHHGEGLRHRGGR